MPVVFVHGVNNRIESPSYKTGNLVMTKFLQRHLAGAWVNGKQLHSVQPRFPYWGGLATAFAWDMASLPTGEIDALGANVPDELRPLAVVIGEEVGGQPQVSKNPLLALARKSLSKAVAALSEVVVGNATESNCGTIATFVADAQAYAEMNPAPAWLVGLTTDEQFVVVLARQVAPEDSTQINSLGTANSILMPLSLAVAKIKSAMASVNETVLDKTGDFASTHILAYVRKPLNAVMGRFFGDVFAYLDSRGDKVAPGAIPRLILDEIDSAVASAPSSEPLVLIGHSLGGVILFDLLGHFRPDLHVDLLITVGSQVSHFEEIKRFKDSDLNVPSPAQPLATCPRNICRWINVFDEVDIFAYACGRVFQGVEDFSYDTGTYVVKAHGAYLEQDRFFARLRKRIDEAPI